MNGLTLEEKACNDDTWKHIHRVQEILNGFIVELIERGHKHDQSKLESPEVEYFAKHTAALAGLTYGSEEYNKQLEKVDLKPAIDHHWANNRHHPQHWKSGIDDMNLIDILELVADWTAASERHRDGNIKKSIEINANRFNISPQLVRILENTVKSLN